MNANENLNGLPEGDWTPDELLRYRQALDEAYPGPKVSIREEVMKQIKTEMAADRAKRRQQRMSRMVKWGSLAACLVLCTTVGIRVLPAVMRGDMKTADHAEEEVAYDVVKEENAPRAAAETGVLYSMTMGSSSVNSGDVPEAAPAEGMDTADSMIQKSMAETAADSALADSFAVTEAPAMSTFPCAETEAAAEEPVCSPAPGAATDDSCESAGWSPEAEWNAEAATESEDSDIAAVIEALWREGEAELVVDGIPYTCTVTEGSLSDWTVEAGAEEVEMLDAPSWRICEADGTGTVQWYDEKTGRIFTVSAVETTEKALTKAAHWLIASMNEDAK